VTKKIIFIDPGTSFGWAEHRNDGAWSKNFSGAITMTFKTPGENVKWFWDHLNALVLTPDRPIAADTIIAWEEAAFSRFGRQDRMYGTWEGILLLFCELHKIEYHALNVATIKAYARKQGFYTRPPQAPRKKKGERIRAFNARLKEWQKSINGKHFDAKPKPRPEWQLSSVGKFQEHEIDARWGLECLRSQLKEENK
jgi:hypothetical protein